MEGPLTSETVADVQQTDTGTKEATKVLYSGLERHEIFSSKAGRT